MKWKDILIGAVASLAVSVTGGIAIYYITKEPDRNKSEQLTFSTGQSAFFKGGTEELAFASVKVENSGGIAARHVVVSIALATAAIKDFALDVGAGANELDREVKPKSVQFTYATLLPRESLTINLLLSAPEKPAVTVRSDSSLGLPEQSVDLGDRESPLTAFLQRSVPLTGILFAFVSVGLAFARRYSQEFGGNDQNNAGFVLLHNGFVDDAMIVLTSAVHSGRYDPYVLSNLAVCRALKGELNEARRLIHAAEYLEVKGRARAVVLFNDALVDLIGGDSRGAGEKLKRAAEIAPREIRKYCKRSVHFQQHLDESDIKAALGA